jgi:hypothetical protein
MIHTIGRPVTAAAALSGTTTTVSLGAAGLLLGVWWVLHHKAASRHHWIDLAVKILLMAAVLVLVVISGFGIGWITGFNHWTAVEINNHSHGKWGTSVGVLTIIEAILILVLAMHVWSLLRRKNEKGGAHKEASPGFDATEHLGHRYGFAAVGPLASTIPGPIGALIAGSFMNLSLAIVHGFGHLFGA